jgi:hypothetical protein
MGNRLVIKTNQIFEKIGLKGKKSGCSFKV